MTMEKKDLRIVFMGTPEFAQSCLKALVVSGFNVVAAVTMPDKPIGRHGSVLQSSPVKKYALEAGIPVLQPEKLKDQTFLDQLASYHAQLQIVVAFRMLPEQVWNMPPMGTFNLHASLLPQYRGAAPINWAIINGDSETGVTTFFLKHEIDTGDIIHQERIPILDTDNAGSLHDKLMNAGAELCCRTAQDIMDGNVRPISQQSVPAGELRPAPKIFKETCLIDWNMPAKKVYDFVRGMSPYPAAWTRLVAGNGEFQDFKIYSLSLSGKSDGTAGTIHTDGRRIIEVTAGDGNGLRLEEVQVAGRRRMSVQDFLCGANLGADSCFE